MQPVRSRWQGLRRFRAESGERGTVLARDVAIPDSARQQGRLGKAKRAQQPVAMLGTLRFAQPTPLSLRAIHVSGKHGFNPAGIRKSEVPLLFGETAVEAWRLSMH